MDFLILLPGTLGHITGGKHVIKTGKDSYYHR